MTPETYSDLFDRLELERVRYVVIGGVAVVLHGYVRPVADLDLAIDRDPFEAQRAMMALAAVGFVPTLPLPLSALTVLRLFDHSEREVDLFVRSHLPFDVWWAGSKLARVGDGSVVARISSIEHILRAKRIDGRPLDLLDIEGLLALEGRGQDRFADPHADDGERGESA